MLLKYIVRDEVSGAINGLVSHNTKCYLTVLQISVTLLTCYVIQIEKLKIHGTIQRFVCRH